MATEYSNASKPTEDVFATVIAANHSRLESARLRVVFQDKTMKQRRKEIIGKVQVLSGLTQHLAQLDIVFKLSEEAWDMLDTQKKEAFIDFLCSQVDTLDDGAGFRLKPLDFGGMLDNVKRYGAWDFDLRRARRELNEQMELPFDKSEQRSTEEIVEAMKLEDDKAFDAAAAEEEYQAEHAEAAA
jgi:hypothetical protein